MRTALCGLLGVTLLGQLLAEVLRSLGFAGSLVGFSDGDGYRAGHLSRPQFERCPGGWTQGPCHGQRRSRHGDEQPRYGRRRAQTSPADDAPVWPAKLLSLDRSAFPRIVGAEIPDVPFQVATRVAASRTVFLRDVEHDLGTGRPGPAAVLGGIGDEEIADLCF